MKKFLNWLPVATIVGLQMFSHIFICWVLLITIIIVGLMWLGVASVFKKKLNIKEPFYRLKAVLVRVFGIVISIGGLYLFIFVFVCSFSYLEDTTYF